MSRSPPSPLEWERSDVSGLAQKVGHDQVLFPELYGLDMQGKQLVAAESAPHQHGGDRIIPLAGEQVAVRARQKPLALIGGEPFPMRTPIRRTPLTRRIPA